MRVNLGHKARYHFSDSSALEETENRLSLYLGAPGCSATVVGRLPPELARLIGGFSREVIVSRVTIMKIRAKHREITFPDIELLNYAFNNARVQRDGPRHLVLLFSSPVDDRKCYKAVVKATRDGAHLILSTY
jgi:hypothetical protein